jgi:glucose-6-phosphate 1-dehydrogenase
MLRGEPVELTVSEHGDPGESDAYEELLTDAIHGISARFARQDYVEEAWRIVDPVLDAATTVYEYEPGSWGPAEANRIAPAGGWFDPVADEMPAKGHPVPAGAAAGGPPPVLERALFA